MSERCILYVDGFNFYYAIKRQSRTVPIYLGWCDFGKLAQRLIEPGASVRAVKYFTAPVAELGEPGGWAEVKVRARLFGSMPSGRFQGLWW